MLSPLIFGLEVIPDWQSSTTQENESETSLESDVAGVSKLARGLTIKLYALHDEPQTTPRAETSQGFESALGGSAAGIVHLQCYARRDGARVQWKMRNGNEK